MDIRLTLPEVLDARTRVLVAREFLGALVFLNRLLIQQKLVGPIYSSGVVYRHEPPGVEEFADALTCTQRGWGDCDDLAAWRVAELNEMGIAATLRFEAAPVRRRDWLVHCVVALPDGSREDPTKLVRG